MTHSILLGSKPSFFKCGTYQLHIHILYLLFNANDTQIFYVHELRTNPNWVYKCFVEYKNTHTHTQSNVFQSNYILCQTKSLIVFVNGEEEQREKESFNS